MKDDLELFNEKKDEYIHELVSHPDLINSYSQKIIHES